MSSDALAQLYDRLDQLVQEARDIQVQVSAAAAENQSRDARRVTPERRTHRRAHAHDPQADRPTVKPGDDAAE